MSNEIFIYMVFLQIFLFEWGKERRGNFRDLSHTTRIWRILFAECFRCNTFEVRFVSFASYYPAQVLEAANRITSRVRKYVRIRRRDRPVNLIPSRAARVAAVK